MSGGARPIRVCYALFWPYSLNLDGQLPFLDSLLGSTRRLGHQGFAVTSETGAELLADHRVSTYRGGGFIRGPRSVRRYLGAVRRVHHEADVLVCLLRYPALAFLADRIHEFRRERVVVVFDTLLVRPRDLSWRTAGGQPIKNAAVQNRLWMRLASFEHGRFVCTTRRGRDQLLGAGAPPSRVTVVPNGVAPDPGVVPGREAARSQFGWKGRQVVGYIGHFSPNKGVETLVESSKHWLVAEPTRVLALAHSGKGSRGRAIRSRLTRLGLGGQVQQLGVVDANAFYVACDLLAFPFTDASIMHFPIVLLEAARLGRPVITTNVGGLPELVREGESGWTVPPRDPLALGRAIDRALRDPTGLEERGDRLRARFREGFHTDHVVRRYLEIAGAG